MSSHDPHLLFSAGGHAFAVSGPCIVEVTRYEDVGDVPRVDLSDALGGPPAQIGPYTCAIIVRGGEAQQAVALVADEATEVVTFRADDLLDPPDFGPNVVLPYLAALARTGEKFAVVLDVGRLLTEVKGDT